MSPSNTLIPMKKIILHICLIIACLPAAAQGSKVEGKVSDPAGEPVIGAAILLSGDSSVGTVSGLDGRWSLIVPDPETARLTISSLGFIPQTVAVQGRRTLDVVLQPDTEQLEEVVVVGYGAMRRSDLTGSVASVRIDEETAAKSASLDQMLEGRIAGVQVIADPSTPDAGINIRIRGLSSFSTSTEPLYVVDGIIVNGESESINLSISKDANTTNTATSVNGLAGINPQDIASMEILKDASATAIYGSQGANGVVLITTRLAGRDRPTLQFEAGATVSVKEKDLDVLGFDEYVTFVEAYGGSTALTELKNMYTGYESPENRGTLAVTPVRWQDYITRKAFSQRWYFSVSGRPKGFNYLFSLGCKDTQGIMKQTGSRNLSMRLNLDRDFGRKAKVGFKANLSSTDTEMTNGSSAGGRITGASSLLRSMLTTKPYAAVNPDDDTVDIEEDESFQYGPNRWLQNYRNTSERLRMQPAVYVQYRLVPFLTFKSTLGGDFESQERIQSRTYRISTIGNAASNATLSRYIYNWDNLLLFNKKWGPHSLSGTLGQSLSRTGTTTEKIQGWYLEQAYAGDAAINSADPQYTYHLLTKGQSSLLSFFARGVYNFKDRYILTATWRLDGSSKFQGRNKWSQFPSAAFAWRLADEPWFHAPVVSNAKLRLGWGQVGNQRIADYQTLQTFGFNNFADHNGTLADFMMGIYPSNIRNPGLKWETSQQVNAGLDLSFWQGRLALTIDAYIKDTKDLLQQKEVARSSGFSTMYVNSGGIRNRGIELSLETVPVRYAGVEWSLGGNLAFNRNIITSAGQEGTSGEIYLEPGRKVGVNYFSGARLSSTATDPLNLFIEGQPIGLFYGYLVDGIVQEGETAPFLNGTERGPGYLKYRDLDGDGLLTDADRTVIGNPLPKFTYGFQTSLSWKGFVLKADFVGSYGADIYHLNNMFDYDTHQVSRNIRRIAFTDAWSAENPGGRFPAVGKWDTIEQIMNSSLFVEDGSFLTLQDLSLSYTFPIDRKRSKVLKGLTATLSCGNAFTWTGYSGWTPRAATTGVSRLGVELNSYPGARSYNVDLKFTF